MGRYAKFTTGYEYKFSFGVQPSRDIETFGGETDDEVISYDEQYDHSIICHWKWCAERDINQVLEEVKRLGIKLPDFEKYDKSREGTHDLLMNMKIDFENNENKENKPKSYLEISRFRLGCAIYHQLLYTSVLKAEYNLV